MSREPTAIPHEPGPGAGGFPLRAFWAWPLGFGLLGGVEATVQYARIGGGVHALLLAPIGAAALGLWAGVLGLLLAVLLRRRVIEWERWPSRWLGDPGPPLVLALVVAAGGWWAVERVHAVFQTRRFDFAEESVQVWRALVVVGAPVGLLALYALMRWLELRTREAWWRAWLVRSAITLLVGWALAHLATGPFVQHFGPAFVLALALSAVLAAASWLPRDVGQGRRAWLLGLLPGLLVLGLGALAFSRPASRALLLHDTRILPVVHGAALAFLDRDGDGETGAWAGGADCDDADPRVGRWHPEVPGNGIDDNCHAGDATSIPLPPPPPAIGPGRLVPVVLITLDTVRADRLELGGYAHETMPTLRDYARGARWFARAYSPSNHTGFSVISILSGQGPEYLVSDPEAFRQHGKRFTSWLPHALAELGYETWAVNPTLVGDEISVEQLRFANYYLGPFDHTPKNRGTRAKQIADWVADFLAERRSEQPLFAWIHIADAHAEHASHEHFPVQSTLDAYDNELRWVDFNLSSIFAAIHRRFGDDVIVILTSDHGEEFGERGAYGHGFALREPMVHVPLLVRAPGLAPGVETGPVNVAGIPAMVLSMLGQPVDRMTVPSVLATGEEPVVLGTPFFWIENRMEVALVEPRWKLIVNRSQGTQVLFDLENDPGESRNLAEQEPEELARMRARLDEALERLR